MKTKAQSGSEEGEISNRNQEKLSLKNLGKQEDSSTPAASPAIVLTNDTALPSSINVEDSNSDHPESRESNLLSQSMDQSIGSVSSLEAKPPVMPRVASNKSPRKVSVVSLKNSAKECSGDISNVTKSLEVLQDTTVSTEVEGHTAEPKSDPSTHSRRKTKVSAKARKASTPTIAAPTLESCEDESVDSTEQIKKSEKDDNVNSAPEQNAADEAKTVNEVGPCNELENTVPEDIAALAETAATTMQNSSLPIITLPANHTNQENWRESNALSETLAASQARLSTYTNLSNSNSSCSSPSAGRAAKSNPETMRRRKQSISGITKDLFVAAKNGLKKEERISEVGRPSSVLSSAESRPEPYTSTYNNPKFQDPIMASLFSNSKFQDPISASQNIARPDPPFGVADMYGISHYSDYFHSSSHFADSTLASGTVESNHAHDSESNGTSKKSKFKRKATVMKIKLKYNHSEVQAHIYLFWHVAYTSPRNYVGRSFCREN